MRRVLLIIGALVLGACASKPSVSEFQCKAGDWESIGYRDGAAGVRNTRILTHQEACGEFGIIPDKQGYMAGWNAGVSEYCTASNGFNHGERGRGLSSVCQGELRTSYAAAYDDGRALYLARSEVNRIRNQLIRYDNRLVQIKQEMIDVTAAQLDPTLLPEERVHLLADLNALSDEKADIHAAIPLLEQDLAASEYELDRISQELANMDYR